MNHKKDRLTPKQKFITGMAMQAIQIIIALVFVFGSLNWSWFHIRYLYYLIGAIVFLAYNIISWRLIAKGEID